MVVWIFFVGHGNFFLFDMRFFVGHGNIFVCMSILGCVFYGHLDDWPTLFCRTSRVEVASRC